jgi:YD repeat-containing protein
VTTASYRDDGHLLTETDALGATTSFDRDRRGQILKEVDPLGRVTVIERDGNGLPAVNSVSYNFGRLPNGQLHSLHSQPHA